MTLADARVRERIRSDLDTSLIIEAAAGTGKTTALVSRIVAVIASGRSQLANIVAVTFTEKAAGELKLRLRSELERARHEDSRGDEEKRRLEKAMTQLEEARIGTIHSFCADLLRERPVEARVDPMFEVAPEDVAGELFERAFDRWFAAVLDNPGEGMRRLLRRRDLAEGEGPRPFARRAAEELVQWRDFDTPWRRFDFDRDSEIDSLVSEISKLGEIAREGDSDDYLARALDDIYRPVSEATRLEAVRGRDYDALEQVLAGLLRGNGSRFRWRGYGDKFGERDRVDVIARRDALRERLERFRHDAGANLAPRLREEMWPLAAAFEDQKRRSGVLDFLDLLLVARDLVRDDTSVRAELQRKFTHIFIDEFQDTDPLQAEILLLLSADDPAESNWEKVRPVPGKLFIVGDPKQSIYRFRRADVALYQILKHRLAERGAAIEHLTVSFRATPDLQEMVNSAIAPLMPDESTTQPAYVALEKYRENEVAQPSIVALPVPEIYGDFGRIVDYRIDQSQPDAIAAFIKYVITDSGWTVTERESPDVRVPIRANHICVLFRRLNSFGRDVTRPYIRALEARHVPHILVRGGSFNAREEVEAIRNLLGAIERPDDELIVFAALRGPVLAVSDDVLFEFHERTRRLHPFQKISDDLPTRLAPVRDALGLLRDLHRGRNRRPIADTIARILAATRAHAGFAIWPTGEQALANVMRLMDMARRYEARGHATSFRGFVDELEERAERDEAGEVPVVEEGTAGVRIMTVHRAKGLEFPVVILADINCKATRERPSRFVDPTTRLSALELAGCAPIELAEHAEEETRRDREEAVRVLYVAATRARDLVVVPTVGDEEHEGWLSGLNDAIYPKENEKRTPLSRASVGCPEFGDDSVLKRPPRAPRLTKSVMPGTHRAKLGEHRVVWWDPSKLTLEVRETMGLRQSKLLEADEARVVSSRGIEAYDAWRASRDATIAKGAAPSFVVRTATELACAGIAPPRALDVELIETHREPNRPHGTRFGSLVHLAMLRVAFEASFDEIAKIVIGEGRLLGAQESEVAAAIRAIETALESDLIERIRRCDIVHRECPIVLTLDEGTVVEGVADLAFVEKSESGEVWNVIDFKTDLDIGNRIDEYRAQVALYMRGFEAATGCPARGALFWI
ncbi:MAG TPA: UvrD-helicase domain-containing protein [Candidatus Binataceae bacterium]|nr:UvrD-helicase domain-containing protein [Candidatus Binataceae bacterium]